MARPEIIRKRLKTDVLRAIHFSRKALVAPFYDFGDPAILPKNHSGDSGTAPTV